MDEREEGEVADELGLEYEPISDSDYDPIEILRGTVSDISVRNTIVEFLPSSPEYESNEVDESDTVVSELEDGENNIVNVEESSATSILGMDSDSVTESVVTPNWSPETEITDGGFNRVTTTYSTILRDPRIPVIKLRRVDEVEDKSSRRMSPYWPKPLERRVMERVAVARVVPVHVQRRLDIQTIPHHRCSIARCPYVTFSYPELLDFYMGHKVCPYRSTYQWQELVGSLNDVQIVGTGQEVVDNCLPIKVGLESLLFNVLSFLHGYRKQLFHPELYFAMTGTILEIGANYEMDVAMRILFKSRKDGLIVVEDCRESPAPRECFVYKRFILEKLMGIYSLSSVEKAGSFLKAVEVGVMLMGYVRDSMEATFSPDR